MAHRRTLNPDFPRILTRPKHNHKSQSIEDFTSQAFHDFFSCAIDPVVVIDTAMKILYANIAGEKLFNFQNQKYLGKKFSELITPESFGKFSDALIRLQAAPQQVRLDLMSFDSHKAELIIEVKITPVLSRQVIVAYRLNLRDVRQERQIEELIRESQKMEAMQYFVDGTAKELKHPLMALLKKIEAIQGKYQGKGFEYMSFKDFQSMMDFLKIIHKQVKACYDKTSKLTDMSKKHLKYESQYSQPNHVIRDVIRQKTSSFKSCDVILKLKLDAHLPNALIGELELNQIITSVIDNSVQAMPAGGHLTVNTQSMPDTQQVKIEIVDDGVGISPEELPHIFEPFYTTKQRGFDRNSGLGLSIVYSLVKSSDGQISIKSSLRKGTTVQILFPAFLNSRRNKAIKK